MPVYEHQQLLQAEVEKREEVDGELGTLLRELERLLPWTAASGLTPISAISQLRVDKEAAESKLTSVEARVAELAEEEWATARTRAADDDVRARCHVRATAYKYVLHLLRDKGTEQGGTDQPSSSHAPSVTDQSPVSIEGDPGPEKEQRTEFRVVGVGITGKERVLANPTTDDAWIDGAYSFLAGGDPPVYTDVRVQRSTVTTTRTPWQDECDCDPDGNLARGCLRNGCRSSTQQSTSGKEDCDAKSEPGVIERARAEFEGRAKETNLTDAQRACWDHAARRLGEITEGANGKRVGQ